MGVILQRIFQIVEDQGGLSARMKLVQMTGITQQQAGEVKDKASLIKQVKKTALAILGSEVDELLK
jgi:hypothetical protein